MVTSFPTSMAEVTLPAIQSSLVPENGDLGFASRGGTAPGNPFDSRLCNSQNLYDVHTIFIGTCHKVNKRTCKDI